MRVVAPLPPWQIRATFPSEGRLHKLAGIHRLNLGRAGQDVIVILRKQHDFARPDFGHGLAFKADKQAALHNNMITDDLRWPSQKGCAVFRSYSHADAPWSCEIGGEEDASRKANRAEHFRQRIHGSGSPSGLDERSNDTVVRSFAATTKKRTSKLSVAPSASARLERPAQPRKSDSNGSAIIATKASHRNATDFPPAIAPLPGLTTMKGRASCV